MGAEDKGLFVKKYMERFFGDVRANDRFSRADTIILLREAVSSFAEAETEENAATVYRLFRDGYRFSQDSDILGLIEMMHTFERRSERIVDSQRDHYIHSVNVFILGLCIFASSKRFRETFVRKHPVPVFRSPEEDFLYIWGLAALFHDIGYPVEIAYNQIRRFLRIASCSDDSKIAPIPEFRHLEDLTRSPGVDTLRMLSERLSGTLGVDFDNVYGTLGGYEDQMRTSGFVDHGFFSAMMLMKWMSPHISKEENSAIRDCVVESSAAILLHNFYNRTFTLPPYSLKPMSPADDPVSFLLILCDELQEWNRTVYGTRTGLVYPSSSRFVIEGDWMEIIYRTASRNMSDDFSDEKHRLFSRLLALDEVFPLGLQIVCTCDRSTDLFFEGLSSTGADMPGYFADRIEEAARAIHTRYNDKMKRREPGKPLKYPDWEGLRDDLKYSNVKQAYSYPDKLAAIGCVMSREPMDAEKVDSFTHDEIEMLSILEHDRWVEERISSGWVYGPQKDSDNRVTPYIVPWDSLPGEIQDYDRDAIRDIIPVLDSMGIGVYRVD